MSTNLTPLQLRALKLYEDAVGDSYFDTPPTKEEVNENHHGDGLLTFLVNEAGDAADGAEARGMLIRAAQQILFVAGKL